MTALQPDQLISFGIYFYSCLRERERKKSKNYHQKARNYSEQRKREKLIFVNMECSWIKITPRCVLKGWRALLKVERKKLSQLGVGQILKYYFHYFSVNKGVSILNQLDDIRFEQFLRRIVSKLKIQDTEIFSEDEKDKLLKIFQLDQESLVIAIKTIILIFKRLLKYIFMPIDLKKYLKSIGLNNEKADFIVKLWSTETRNTLNELGSEPIHKYDDILDFSWKVNAELSSDSCKKTKVPKAYLLLSRENEDTEIELTHPELYSMFLQFEAIQTEIDNLGI